MLLAIDAGNTRIKWALFDAKGKVQTHGACFHAEFDQVTLPISDKVIISNVAGEAVATALLKKLPASVPVQWVSAQAQVLDIKNNYDTAETLGSDRWAAVVAAWQQQNCSCIVVNAGTTVTIDTIIAEAQGASFMGGVILPGITMMQKSLHTNTAQLSDFSHQRGSERYNNMVATNTKDAIQMGAFSAVTGAIHSAYQVLSAKIKATPAIILSGGDAQVIANYYAQTFNANNTTNKITILDNLVLLGLFSLHNDAQSNKTNKHLEQSGTL